MARATTEKAGASFGAAESPSALRFTLALVRLGCYLMRDEGLRFAFVVSEQRCRSQLGDGSVWRCGRPWHADHHHMSASAIAQVVGLAAAVLRAGYSYRPLITGG